MSLCDRCTGGDSCPLIYLGEACKRYRQRECPEIQLTNGDKIRSMSDAELAGLFAALASQQRTRLIKWMHDNVLPIKVDVIEMPMLTIQAHLEWLRSPAEEEKE